jgi:hypothetical protein
MKREELRQEFERACEIKWENSQGEPDIDYVMWLEDKILSRHLSGGIVDITAEEFIREKMRQKYGIENKEMAGLWTYKCNGEEALRWAHEFANIKNAPLPPAEGATLDHLLDHPNGAEEIRQLLLGWEHYKRDHFRESEALDVEAILMSEYSQIAAQHLHVVPRSVAIDAMTEFAALHAQRLAEKMKEASQFILDIARVLGMETDGVGFDGLTLSIDDFKEAAEKMVSERLREELIKFDAWGYGSFTENKAIIDDVDEYLKSRER